MTFVQTGTGITETQNVQSNNREVLFQKFTYPSLQLCKDQLPTTITLLQTKH